MSFQKGYTPYNKGKKLTEEHKRKICGKLQGDIAHPVHHIDYNKKNCNLDNLITLCINCHAKTNYNREYWKEYLSILLNNN